MLTISKSYRVPSRAMNINKHKPFISRVIPNYQRIVHRRYVKTAYSMTDFAQTVEYNTYLISKGFILFFLFSSTLNWYYYKRIGDDIKKEQEKTDKKD